MRQDFAIFPKTVTGPVELAAHVGDHAGCHAMLWLPVVVRVEAEGVSAHTVSIKLLGSLVEQLHELLLRQLQFFGELLNNTIAFTSAEGTVHEVLNARAERLSPIEPRRG